MATADEVDVNTLGVKALRELITQAGLSYGDCLEKAELRERAHKAMSTIQLQDAHMPAVAWVQVEPRHVEAPVVPGAIDHGKVRGVWWGICASDLPSKSPGTTRFVVVSDTHEHVEESPRFAGASIPEGDVFLHCGDFTQMGTAVAAERFCDWLDQLTGFKDKVVIAGNHDSCTDPAFGSCEDTLERLRQSAHYLCGSSVSVAGGHVVWGSPTTCWEPRKDGGRPRWAHGVTWGAACQDHGATVPHEVDVVMTHQPPLGRRDAVDNAGKGHAGGCIALREAIEKARPAVHAFGHIHEGHGVSSDGTTLYVNAATLVAAGGAEGGLREPLVFDLANNEH
eukprot:m.10313 g.10313  ORF g.10313 m.10313 type:complete len:338 (+) comp4300_c0_seq1:51-1064(+)